MMEASFFIFLPAKADKPRRTHRSPCKWLAHVFVWLYFGGDKRDRTADLLNAIQALSQLSYTPEYFVRFSISPQRKIYITRQIAICQQEN